MPKIPVVIPTPKYVDGLGLSYADVDTLQVAAGACKDSTNVALITAASGLILDRNAVGAGGIDIGTPGASQTYAVYVIGDSTSYQPTAALYSLNPTQPLLPHGYDMYRRIGWIITNGASEFQQLTYTGSGTARWVHFKGGVTVLPSGNDTAFTAIDCKDGVFTDGLTQYINVQCGLELDAAAAGNAIGLAIPGTGVSSTSYNHTADAIGITSASTMHCVARSTGAGVATIEYSVSQSGDTAAIYVLGFEDILA